MCDKAMTVLRSFVSGMTCCSAVVTGWMDPRMDAGGEIPCSRGMNAPCAPASSRRAPGRRADYLAFHDVTTRWADNDPYGHINNVVYLSWFDTAVNHFLISRGLLDIAASEAIGVMAENGCRYHSELSYPDEVVVGMRVAHLGRSSVRWEAAAFRRDAEFAAAEGHLVHVYVTRATMRPTPIPERTRAALAGLLRVVRE
jgi:acyl-CoA thioester hydrolase